MKQQTVAEFLAIQENSDEWMNWLESALLNRARRWNTRKCISMAGVFSRWAWQLSHLAKAMHEQDPDCNTVKIQTVKIAKSMRYCTGTALGRIARN